LITSDGERYTLPDPQGFVLPARERLQERGVTFDRYYVASAQCSSSRSVIYTGQRMPLTEIYDNDNMPYIRPLDPALGTLGSMLRTADYHCAYQGKWHLSRAYKDPNDPRPTTDALEPYGFSEFNDWGATWTAGPGPGSRWTRSSRARQLSGCATGLRWWHGTSCGS
jgi:arylsulfatase A-like enzyme